MIRDNLHLGVGFLAATAGLTGEERLRFRRVETAAGSWSMVTAGAGEPILFLHGLGATKGSFLPTVAALAGVIPHDRGGPPGLRRHLQAARGALPSAVLRTAQWWN